MISTVCDRERRQRKVSIISNDETLYPERLFCKSLSLIGPYEYTKNKRKVYMFSVVHVSNIYEN